MPRWKNGLQTNDEIQRIKRDAVIKEAGLAFSRRGYHNTSLDDVAKVLQVSKGTLYNYVKDKHEILYACHQMALDIGEWAFEDAKGIEGNGLAVLEATLRRYIEKLTGELGACGVLMEIDALRPEEREIIAKRRRVFEKDFTAIIQKGMKDGSIRAVDPKLAVFTFMGAINWMPRWFDPEGRLSGDEVARQMTDLLLSGLSSAPAPALAIDQGPAKSSRARRATVA